MQPRATHHEALQDPLGQGGVVILDGHAGVLKKALDTLLGLERGPGLAGHLGQEVDAGELLQACPGPVHQARYVEDYCVESARVSASGCWRYRPYLYPKGPYDIF